jgi:DNA gyrase subunit B
VSQKKKNQSQNDEPIQILDHIEHVRLRPGMYFGGNDTKALNYLVYELLEGVRQQARHHICTSLSVTILGPQTLQIRDNGEGIPPHAGGETDKHHLEYLLLYAGSNFVSNWDFATKGIRWGMDRLTHANAVSLHMRVEVRRDGAVWEQHYRQGRKTSEIIRVRDLMEDEESGTSLTFTIDNDIFPDAAFNSQWIQGRLSDMAYLLPGLTVKFEDHIRGERNAFYSRRGLPAYIEHENRYKRVLCTAMELHMVVQHEPTIPPFELDAALQFLRTPAPYTRSFVNASETVEHGTHVDACFEALRDSLLVHSDIIKRHDVPDIFQHVTLVVNLWHRSPDFNFRGNAIRALLNRDISQRLYEEVSLALLLYFREYPTCIPRLEALALENRKKKQGRRAMRLI